MNEPQRAYIERQLGLMSQRIGEYEDRRRGLDALISDLEALTSAMNLEHWTKAASAIIGGLEQVNASAQSEDRTMSPTDQRHIAVLLEELWELIRTFGRT
jgi:hypothetical protein